MFADDCPTMMGKGTVQGHVQTSGAEGLPQQGVWLPVVLSSAGRMVQIA